MFYFLILAKIQKKGREVINNIGMLDRDNCLGDLFNSVIGKSGLIWNTTSTMYVIQCSIGGSYRKTLDRHVVRLG